MNELLKLAQTTEFSLKTDMTSYQLPLTIVNSKKFNTNQNEEKQNL